MNDITFFMQIHNDIALALLAIKRLRRFYPDCNLVCLFDGEQNDYKYKDSLKKYNVDIIKSSNLYRYSYNSLMLYRKFIILLDYESDYYIKIDTDTHFHRPFKGLPKIDCSFGHKRRAQGVRFIQGGFIGYTRNILSQIVMSGFLERMFINNDRKWIRDKGGLVAGLKSSEYYTNYNISPDDIISAYVIRTLGLRLEHHKEVYSCWGKNIKLSDLAELKNSNLVYAVTHPCREKIYD